MSDGRGDYSSSNHPQQRWTSFELDCIHDIEQSSATPPETHTPPGSTLSSSSFSGSQSFFESSDEHQGGFPGGGQPTPANTNPDTQLWDGFEHCAYSVARLYREASWHSFQKAAQASTQFYKDSTDANRRSVELGMGLGRQRLLKEIIGYLKCSNRSAAFIRREDLLAFLAGKSPPLRHHSSWSPVVRTMDQLHLQSSPTSCHPDTAPDSHDNSAICMFREALSLDTGSSPVFNGSPRSSPSRRLPDLSAFLAAECRKHRKRRQERDPSVPAPFKRNRRL